MSGPFSGFGIQSDLQVESFQLQKIHIIKNKKILSSNNIMETFLLKKLNYFKKILYPI